MDAHTIQTTNDVPADGSIGGLLHRITRDVKTIAHDELELIRDELTRTTKVAAADAAIVLLGAIVALIGFGLLCLSAVVALHVVIASLAIRLLLVAIVYLGIGGVVAGAFGMRLKRDIVPDLTIPKYEAKRTIDGVKHTIQEGAHVHA